MSATVVISIFVNGEVFTMPGGSVLELLHLQRVDTSRKGFAVALNGDVVPRRDWESQRLSEGDRVEIVGMYKGG